MSRPPFPPGPWRANGRQVESGADLLAVINLAMPKAEAEATTRLIAAAPQLYEALRKVYDLYVVDMHGARACDCDTHVETCAPCLARAALAEVDA